MKESFTGERRLRRMRQTPGIRDLCRETFITPCDLIQPLFVIEGEGKREAISSMPGQFRLSIDELCQKCEILDAKGIRGVALFPSIQAELKTERGEEALNESTLILRAIRAVKSAVPELLVFADIALDPYTTHGHDGILNEFSTDVANDETVEILCRMAILNAKAGADFVAPSDMMDFRIGAIRHALDNAGLSQTGIMAYSAKFNSAYYGPFRDAVGSSKAAKTTLLSKATYQLDPSNCREALREAAADAKEGADIIMVKPAGAYLDIIRSVRDALNLPIAAYQVSGEYAQICAAAERGWLNRERCRDESLIAIKRAGADIILSYFAEEIAL